MTTTTETQEIPLADYMFHKGLLEVNPHAASRYMAYIRNIDNTKATNPDEFEAPDQKLTIDECFELAESMAEDYANNPRSGFLTTAVFSKRSGRSKRSIDKENPNAWEAVKSIFSAAVESLNDE